MIEWLMSGIAGGVVRMMHGAVSAAPTLLAGLLIASVLRYYFGAAGTRRLFGGGSLRSLPQSWAIGMLLPVCSIGVLPILIEMRRSRVKPGAMSAFALSAPLFNPLSLLYGLTLSRPYVILLFALGSLVVVTAVGMWWDRGAKRSDDGTNAEDAVDSTESIVGATRAFAVFLHMTRQLAGPSGKWALLGLTGLVLLSVVLPFGAMQGAVERDDWAAPATMTAVALPAYATPMLAMSQLGMMFQHANSPGAAFVLLVLGTGVNIATVAWLAKQFGARSVAAWFASLVLIVTSIAYVINRPLIPPGVEPAGHTHAFDIYSSPFPSFNALSWQMVTDAVRKNTDLGARWAMGVLVLLAFAGAGFRYFRIDESRLRAASKARLASRSSQLASFDRPVSPQLVGATLLVGLIALSVVTCYGYYPAPEETLEEIRITRVETLSAARSGNIDHALFWLENWEDWSRRLEVGTFLRRGEVRPYQRMQGYLIRKKLELLEHELEHDPFEPEEAQRVVDDLQRTDRRWVQAFQG